MSCWKFYTIVVLLLFFIVKFDLIMSNLIENKLENTEKVYFLQKLNHNNKTINYCLLNDNKNLKLVKLSDCDNILGNNVLENIHPLFCTAYCCGCECGLAGCICLYCP